MALRLLLLYFSAVFALAFVVGTGLIADWGHWYSPSTPFRQQTEAFLEGRVALSYSPAEIQHDMAWAEGSVQHVWGLGVPAIRLPFEAAARVAGQPAFPDRLVLALAILLTGFLLLRIFTVGPDTRTIGAWIDGVRARPGNLLVVLLLLFFPPLLSMSRGPFNVYEEVVAYGYLYSVLLFAGLVALYFRPRFGLYVLLCLAAGFIGFIRPTMLAYGFASVALALVLTRFLKWSWMRSITGAAAFGVGGALLFYTNWLRFGSGFEFGHALNMTGGEVYTTRFGAPYANEPLWSAAKELFGALFFVKELNGFAVHEPGVVAWQSETIRWRHFYFSVFNVSYLVMALIGWALAGWTLLRLRRGVATGSTGIPSESAPAAAREHRPPGYSSGLMDDLRPAVVTFAGIWSLLAAVPLAGFYLNLFGLSSRYSLDFGPAFAVAMAGAIWGLAEVLRGGVAVDSRRNATKALSPGSVPGSPEVNSVATGRLWGGVLAGAVVVWWTWEVATAESYFPRTAVFDREQALRATPRATSPSDLPSLPEEYVADESRGYGGIGYNGRGWDRDGRTESVVIVFVDDPEFLILDVAAAEGEAVADEDFRRIRAKIGREHLTLETLEDTATGKRLRFAGPRRNAYRQGMQMASIAFVIGDDYDRRPPFVLERVRWRNASLNSE